MSPSPPRPAPPPTPADDGPRLAALRATGLLDSPPERRFDRLTGFARRLLGVPVALVSLVDDERQFFKSHDGLAEPWASERGTPRSHSFCQYVVVSGEPFQVDDARADARVCDHPAVDALDVAAYLGVPIRDPDGHVLGSLCALDHVPRAWTAGDRAVLRDLADAAESEVALSVALDRRTRSEARYRALFDHSPDAVLLLDPETEEVLDANRAALDLYGADRGDLVGTSARAFSQDPKRGDAVAGRLLAEGGTARFGSVQRRRDGTPIYVRIGATAVEVGGRRALLSVNRDVTEEVRAKAALSERTASLQAITDHTPDFIARFDRDLRYRFVNRAAASLLGSPAASFVGRTQAEVGFDPGAAARRSVHLRQVFETGRPVEAEYATTIGGRAYWFQTQMVPERGDDGRFDTVLVVSRDVTARREAEAAYQATRAQADRLALVAARTTNGVVVTDADGLVEWVNEGFTQLSGYALDEIRGRKPGHVLQGPDTDPDTVAYLHERMRSREPFTAELLNVHKSGRPYWVRIEVAPLVEDDGTLTGFMAIESDVTERKEAERRAADLRAFYESVLDQNEAEVAVFDRDLRYVYVSPSGVGDPDLRAWLVGRTNRDYCRRRGIDEALARDREAAFARAFETEEPQSFEETVGPAGDRRHYVRVVSPIRGPDGAVTHVAGYSIDLTEQKAAEAAVRASEARYRGVVESVRDVVVQADLEGRWSFLNPAWETVTGFTVAECLGRPCLDTIHPDDHAEHVEQFEALFEGEVPFVRHESRLLTRGGGVRHVEFHAQLLRGEGGAVEGTVGTVTDITDSVRFEAEREARERTEEALRLKSAFLDNMSHELRTPLTGILGFAEVLADEVGEGQREPVEVIVRSANRLLDTLNSVLDLAQLESGSFTLGARSLDVRDEAEEVAQMLAPLAARRGVALDVVGRPTPALADRAALHRVLTNLVGNAVKFTDEGGVVVETGADAAGPWVRVTDSGIGIDPAFVPRLFDEFAQASEGYARTHEGNGLGLAITHRLVGLMGGTVEVESEPGVGSAFTVRLPAAEGAAPPEAAPPAWVAGGAGRAPAGAARATG